QIVHAGFDVVLGVEAIAHPEQGLRRRHELHQALSTARRLRQRVELAFTLDHGFDQRGIESSALGRGVNQLVVGPVGRGTERHDGEQPQEPSEQASSSGASYPPGWARRLYAMVDVCDTTISTPCAS